MKETVINTSELVDGACLRVPLSLIVDAPWGNVRRKKRDAKKYSTLRESIEGVGVTQPVTVRPNDADNTLQLLAGYGRRQASLDNALLDIPVLVKRVSDKEAMAIGLTENLQREDLSIVDQIRIAQQYISLFDGDYAEAAKAVGWSEKILRGRLKLNDCSADVLDALELGEISIGHCEVLCQFTPSLQDNTLVKLKEEGWTVDYLKERANKANRFLRHAKFDTAGCSQCPHNSSFQATLFDNHVGSEKCGNLQCFKEKTEAWLSVRKEELEREHGVVLVAIEKPESDRRTVSESIVGEAAFVEDCLGCPSRVRILKDGINKDVGDVIDHQCINLSCYNEKIEVKKADDAGALSKTKTSAKKTAKKTSAKNISKPALSAGVQAQAKAFARTVIGEALLEQKAFSLAVTLSALCEISGYQPEKEHKRLGGRIEDFSGWDTDRLSAEIDLAVRHAALKSTDGAHGFNATETILGASKWVSDGSERLVKNWSPSQEWLEGYQKGSLEGFCKQENVGFAKAYDAALEDGVFNKLMKQKKSEIISTILAFDFDWSPVAPKEVLSLVG